MTKNVTENKMAEKTKNKETNETPRGGIFIPGHWAIQKSALKHLATSTFGDWYFKENGSVDHVNIVDEIENKISVIHIDGALTYRSDLSKAWMGLDTYDSITDTFNLLIKNPDCLGIILDINSPGGEVSGCVDLVNAIFAARGSKPYGIVARTGGQMCSAAYWIGSAAEKIYTSEQGVLGSIGVLCAYDPSSSENEILIVSDLSPNKAPTPDDPEGLFLIKKTLNELASVFIQSVARNRGTDYQDVLLNYGQGGIFVGDGAVKAGLADGVMSMDALMNQMITQKTQTEASMAGEKKEPADGANQPTADALAAATSAAIASERTRVAGIQGAFKGLGLEGDCEKFISEGKSVEDARFFALEKCKEKISAEPKAPDANADVDAIAAKAALAGLSQTQKDLIKKGLAAESAAQNGVQGGMGQNMSDQARRDGFAAKAAKNHYGRI